MTTTPEQFAQLLQNSSLSAEQKKEVLDMLPYLDEEDRETLVQILKQDEKEQQKIWAQGDAKNEKIQHWFEHQVAQEKKNQA